MRKYSYLLTSLVLCGVLMTSGWAAAKPVPAGITVWFNGREGDLERPVVKVDGKLHISFIDLVRHRGGMLAWGPDNEYIEARRDKLVVRVTSGADYALVNEVKTTIDGQNQRIGSRMYVPLTAYCKILGGSVEKDPLLPRVYVRWSEK